MLFALIKLLLIFVRDLSRWLIRKLLPFALIILLALPASALLYRSMHLEADSYVTLKIPSTMSFRQLTSELVALDAVRYPLLFRLSAVQQAYDRQIRSGEFKVPVGMNEWDLVRYLKMAAPETRKVTLIEGLRYRDAVREIATVMDLDTARFSALKNDPQLLREFNLSHGIEGYLMPETYLFTWGMSEREILRYLIQRTVAAVRPYKARLDSLNYSELQIMTLASIIEAECNDVDEMPIVSSVYHNRLNRGWKLEADPTILYILGSPQRVLFKHLKINSPYNTYKYQGLPPAPINSPSRAAIRAALYPANTEYMFFTGTGDGRGRHLFGRTLREHNRNRRQLDAARRNQQ